MATRKDVSADEFRALFRDLNTWGRWAIAIL